MNDLPKSPATKHDGVREPLVGGDELDLMQVNKGDLSDWVESSEAVAAVSGVTGEGAAGGGSGQAQPLKDAGTGFNFPRPGFTLIPHADSGPVPLGLAFDVGI